MSLMDPLQPGFQKLYVDGIEQSPARGGINFPASVTVTDDPANNRKNITGLGGVGNVSHPGASVITNIPVYNGSSSGPGADLVDSGLNIADLLAASGSGTLIGTTVTASRNLASGDAGKLTEAAHASTPIVITVQPNSVVALPVGHTSHWFRGDAAAVSFAEVGPAVIVKSQTLILASQGAMCTLIKVGTDRWLLTGEMELA